ncbi:DNA-directed RNA polymerase [Sulfuracidifex tepidarius]|uniref:DNA-directed RNA polymerase subunit Rpo7 n=1 Tax=Sulfuracidifex tepidarius TaxID=1294262 RepID=A0A510DVF0_9CREN|nr:DNA-directed RNA polymerase [Sulfuracidifex tepidarius]BBG24202.1 DNA-directed RNA polymerase subunit E [Sulfuracidifex tepidarius]BBG26959.1 DNA-directed RNA polymerase subunit E [Sulfuracidifex tepidarius]
MYKLIKAKGIVRIPPESFGKPLEGVALENLKQDYQEKLSSEFGLVLAILSAKVSEEGQIVYGDGATYHEVEFEVLSYVPMIQEVAEGEVQQVDNYGVYVNLGPMDGLLHISQITDENMKYDKNRGIMYTEKTKKTLQKDDLIRVRIFTISTSAGRLPKIALTSRQPALGKAEWIKK